MNWYFKSMGNGWLENKSENYDIAIEYLIEQYRSMKSAAHHGSMNRFFEEGIRQFFGKEPSLLAESKDEKKAVEFGTNWARTRWHEELLVKHGEREDFEED